MDLVTRLLVASLALEVGDVQRHLGRPIKHGGTKGREEREGKIKANGTTVRPKAVFTWG